MMFTWKSWGELIALSAMLGGMLFAYSIMGG